MEDLQRHTAPPATLSPAFQPLTEDELAYRVALAIAARRQELGWSQAELAKRVGMRQPHISRLESHTKLPSLTTLLRIANAMGAQLVITLERHDA